MSEMEAGSQVKPQRCIFVDNPQTAGNTKLIAV